MKKSTQVGSSFGGLKVKTPKGKKKEKKEPDQSKINTTYRKVIGKFDSDFYRGRKGKNPAFV